MILTRNFSSSEFVDASHAGCIPVEPFSRAAWWSEIILQPMRDAFGIPIRVTSFNRCIPGRIGSGAHGLGGEAVDCIPLNITNPLVKCVEMAEWLRTYKPEHLGKVLVEISPVHLHLTTRGPEAFRGGGSLQVLREEPNGEWAILYESDFVTGTAREKLLAETKLETENEVSETYKEYKDPISTTPINVGGSVPESPSRILFLGSLGLIGGLVMAKAF